MLRGRVGSLGCAPGWGLRSGCFKGGGRRPGHGAGRVLRKRGELSRSARCLDSSRVVLPRASLPLATAAAAARRIRSRRSWLTTAPDDLRAGVRDRIGSQALAARAQAARCQKGSLLGAFCTPSPQERVRTPAPPLEWTLSTPWTRKTAFGQRERTVAGVAGQGLRAGAPNSDSERGWTCPAPPVHLSCPLIGPALYLGRALPPPSPWAPVPGQVPPRTASCSVTADRHAGPQAGRCAPTLPVPRVTHRPGNTWRPGDSEG